MEEVFAVDSSFSFGPWVECGHRWTKIMDGIDGFSRQVVRTSSRVKAVLPKRMTFMVVRAS